MTQQKKLLLSLATTLVFALALGAYAYYGVFQREQEELEAQENEGKLFSLDTSKVTALEIVANGETTSLELRDGRWEIVSPIAAPADEAALNRLVADLDRARYRRLVQEEGEMLPFGLEKPPIRVEARTADGESAYIAVGLGNPFDSTYYVSDREGRVATAEAAVKTFFEKSTFDLRKKELIPWKAADLEGISLEGETPWELARAEEGWTLASHEGARTDEKEVDELLRKALALRATAFPDRGSLELDEPIATLHLRPRDGEAMTVRIWKEEEKAYAQASGGDLAEVATSSLDFLETKPDELRDLRVAPFDTETISRIEVSGAETFTLARTDEGWAITSPEEGPARRWKVNAGLKNLSELRPEETFAEDAEVEHGLDAPTHTVRIFDREGTLVGAYHFGAEEADHSFVRREGDEAIYKVRSRSVINVPRSLEDVREEAEPEEG